MSQEEPDSELLSQATDSADLETRIAKNRSAQSLDFIDWIFRNMSVSPGERVLELCCGTGAQTLRFLEEVGEAGEVVAMDISAESIETLSDRVPAEHQSKATLIEGDTDDLRAELTAAGVEPAGFDRVFCAYGLYYADDPESVLEASRDVLAEDGDITIVGPYGSNNGPWFSFLYDAGVTIPEFVEYTSSTFMPETVLPWAVEEFESVDVETAVNHIERDSAEELFEYWESSTYFDQDNADAVRSKLERYFENEETFVNRKWIMHLTMSHQRDEEPFLTWS